MSGRVEQDVVRPTAVTIIVDGVAVAAFPGETVLAALLAGGQAELRRDALGRPRGAWCNMGTCGECMVRIRRDGVSRRVRACLTPIAAGMTIATGGDG